MRLGIVVQRYGADVAGGAELHARQFAHRLSERHEVTALASCAHDYITWKNHYPEGPDQDGPVRVRRFRVTQERDPQRFHDVSQRVFLGRATRSDQELWFLENGPVMPGLLDYLKSHGNDYDAFLFFSFRYYQCFFGLPLVAPKAVLVPTAEDDAALRLPILREFFRVPRAYVHNSPEERTLLRRVAGPSLPPGEVIGCGIDEPGPDPGMTALERLGVRPPYALWLGRIDRNKGCDTLMRHFKAFADERARELPLVLAGKAVIDVPDHPALRHVGFVSEDERSALLRHARVLVNHSPFESLSLVLLESWNHARPVLVNGHCTVMREQVRRCSGGLYYENYREMAACLEWMLDHEPEASRLGRQGRAFVDAEYRWPVVLERIERVLRHCLT